MLTNAATFLVRFPWTIRHRGCRNLDQQQVQFYESHSAYAAIGMYNLFVLEFADHKRSNATKPKSGFLSLTDIRLAGLS